MNYEQRRTHAKARNDLARIEAALQAVPTLDSSTYRLRLPPMLNEVQHAITASELADRELPRARADVRKAEQALLEVTEAVVVILAARRTEFDASPVDASRRSQLELSRDVLENLKQHPELAVLSESLDHACERFTAAEERANGAASAQRAAENRVYETHDALFFAIRDATRYIKIATDKDSVARQRLKLRRKSAKRRAMEGAAPVAERAVMQREPLEPA